MVRRDDCAEPSLAARLDERRLGMAMAAIMPIIATTMRSSIREKPFWPLFVISFLCSLEIRWLFFFAPPALGSNSIDRSARFFHVGFYQALCQMSSETLEARKLRK